MKNIDWDFLKKDMTFIILNCLVNRIPCWRIRKKFYEGFGMAGLFETESFVWYYQE